MHTNSPVVLALHCLEESVRLAPRSVSPTVAPSTSRAMVLIQPELAVASRASSTSPVMQTHSCRGFPYFVGLQLQELDPSIAATVPANSAVTKHVCAGTSCGDTIVVVSAHTEPTCEQFPAALPHRGSCAMACARSPARTLPLPSAGGYLRAKTRLGGAGCRAVSGTGLEALEKSRYNAQSLEASAPGVLSPEAAAAAGAAAVAQQPQQPQPRDEEEASLDDLRKRLARLERCLGVGAGEEMPKSSESWTTSAGLWRTLSLSAAFRPALDVLHRGLAALEREEQRGVGMSQAAPTPGRPSGVGRMEPCSSGRR